MELNSLLKDMGLVDVFSTTVELEPAQDPGGTCGSGCESSCSPGCSGSCVPSCSTGCK